MRTGFLRRNGEIAGVLVLFVAAFLARLVLLQNTDNFISGEAPGRVLQTMSWMNNPGYVPGHYGYGPLHFYLMAGALYLWNDPAFSPRLISLIFGALLILPFYYFVRLIFDRGVAFWSAIIACFYPLHLQESVLTTADVPFAFFLFSALYFFFRYKRASEKKTADLIVSGALFNFASSLRFEAWIYIFILAVFLLNEKKRGLAGFVIPAMVYPAFYMIGAFKSCGNPFVFASGSANAVLNSYCIPMKERIIGFSGVFWTTLSPLILISGYLGVLRAMVKRKKSIYPAVMFLLIFLLAQYKIIAGTLRIDEARITIHLGLLLIPFAVWFLSDYLLGRINGRRKNILLALIFLPLFWLFAQKSMESAKKMRLPEAVKDISSWLDIHSRLTEDVVLMDRDYVFSPSIVLNSRIPVNRVYVVADKGADGAVSFCNGSEAVKASEIFRSKKPKYLVAFVHEEGSVLSRYYNIDFERQSFQLQGCNFRPVFETAGYSESTIKYPEDCKFRIYEASAE